jgi:predicted ATPase/DNA-binding XRE family transcriptional regulator
MTNADPGPFGALLLRLRAAAGLTQEQLAARAGLSPKAIAALERGKRRSPRAATVELLANALGLEAPARAQFIAAAHDPSQGSSRWSRQPSGEPTPLIGRTAEQEIICQRLMYKGVRLLTLTGPAGVGKTRLALAAAARLAEDTDHFPTGVTLVDLAPIHDAHLVPPAIAHALGLADTAHPPLPVRLRDFLRERTHLLVLDNFEQVLPAGALLAELLASCAGLQMLVTSREPLQLQWEQTLRVPPLPVPDRSAPLPPLDALLAVPSVELFVKRAQGRRADFVLREQHAPLVAEVVAQLDGLPLALELAAARLDVLSLPTLARWLGDRLQLLESAAPDRPERQRSLEAAVGWSYDLLPDSERQLFRCLGVFVGRVSLNAIKTVASAVSEVRVAGAARATKPAASSGEAGKAERTLSRLLALAEKSLLLPVHLAELPWQQGGGEEAVENEEDAEPAFGMLETVREYAWERLAAAGELESARGAHAHYFLALAEQADAALRGSDQRACFLRLEREHDNLRAALRWLLDQEDPAERTAGLRLAAALGYFEVRRGYLTEGVRWLEEALARAPQTAGEAEEGDTAVHTRALLIAGAIHTMQDEFAQARVALEEALAQAERLQDPIDAAMALMYLGICAAFAGEVEKADHLLHEARRRWELLGDPGGLGQTLLYLGFAADRTGDVPVAAAHYTAALKHLETAGDAYLAGEVHNYLGVADWRRGDLRSAVEHIQAAVRIGVALRDRWLLARLLWTTETDALAQATGAKLGGWARQPGEQDVAGLRNLLAQGEEGELAAAYREGRALPFGKAAALALTLLEEAAETLPPQTPEEQSPLETA